MPPRIDVHMTLQQALAGGYPICLCYVDAIGGQPVPGCARDLPRCDHKHAGKLVMQANNIRNMLFGRHDQMTFKGNECYDVWSSKMM
jgi:hypothetical protein